MADRTTARIIGILFIVATAAGVSAGIVQQPALDVADDLAAVNSFEGTIATGVLLELVMAIAVFGIVVALYPVLRRHSERLAFGFAAARTIEIVTYGLSTVAVLTLIPISSAFVESGRPAGSSYEAAAQAMLDAREWSNYTFQIIVFALSAVFLNLALSRYRLVPRWLALWGLLAALPYLCVGVLSLYGLEPFSTVQILLVAPLALQEMVFALWLIVRGFTAPAIETAREERRELVLT